MNSMMQRKAARVKSLTMFNRERSYKQSDASFKSLYPHGTEVIFSFSLHIFINI